MGSVAGRARKKWIESSVLPLHFDVENLTARE